MTEKETKARYNFDNGCNCSQAVAAVFAENIGISEDEAKKITPKPRSIGGKCGALLAANMIMDKLGIDKKEEFEQKFKEATGIVVCKYVSKDSKPKGTCTDICGDAARILEEMINE